MVTVLSLWNHSYLKEPVCLLSVNSTPCHRDVKSSQTRRSSKWQETSFLCHFSNAQFDKQNDGGSEHEPTARNNPLGVGVKLLLVTTLARVTSLSTAPIGLCRWNEMRPGVLPHSGHSKPSRVPGHFRCPGSGPLTKPDFQVENEPHAAVITVKETTLREISL